MAMLALILMAANVLVFSGISSVANFAKNGYWNPPGPTTANLTNNGRTASAQFCMRIPARTLKTAALSPGSVGTPLGTI
jgi:hypothetical protein